MIIYTIIMSLTMFALGVYFKKNAPNKINKYWGYRSKRALSGQEAWDFAQKEAGKSYIILSVVNLVMFTVVYFFIRNMENYKDIFLICAYAEIGVLLVAIPFVEIKLKKFLYKKNNIEK